MVFIVKSVSCTVGFIWAFVSLSQGVTRDHTEFGSFNQVGEVNMFRIYKIIKQNYVKN